MLKLLPYLRLRAIGVLLFATVLLGSAAPAYAFSLTSASQFTKGFAAGTTTCPTLSGTLGTNDTPGAATGTGETCLMTHYVDPIVKALSALVGVFVVLSIIIAGIQYSAAADDSSKVAAAKGRIQKALMALLAYVFLLAFVNYLLPGGV